MKHEPTICKMTTVDPRTSTSGGPVTLIETGPRLPRGCWDVTLGEQAAAHWDTVRGDATDHSLLTAGHAAANWAKVTT